MQRLLSSRVLVEFKLEADKTELGKDPVIDVTFKNENLKQFVLAALGLILISWFDF